MVPIKYFGEAKNIIWTTFDFKKIYIQDTNNKKYDSLIDIVQEIIKIV